MKGRRAIAFALKMFAYSVLAVVLIGVASDSLSSHGQITAEAVRNAVGCVALFLAYWFLAYLHSVNEAQKARRAAAEQSNTPLHPPGVAGVSANRTVD